MAETVQYMLEQMLPELEDLRDKGLFTEVRPSADPDPLAGLGSRVDRAGLRASGPARRRSPRSRRL